MTNLEKLQSSPMKADHALADFITARGEKAISLVNASKAFNRGDFAEMALTLAPVARDGLHGVSKGDAVLVINGQTLIIEIKYITKKTSASEALKGTVASHYLLACNDGNRVTLRLMRKEEMKKRIVSGAEKIAYQDNYNLGQEIALGLEIRGHDEAVEYFARLLQDKETALFYEEMANDYLYTRGNGYEMQHEISIIRAILKALTE